MAPPRRLSNGRSPLVNQQSQITKFFNKTTSTSTTTSPSPPTFSKLKNPKPDDASPSPSPSQTSPSPQQTVPKKDVKSTTRTKTASVKVLSYGEEVLNKGIRVYWPLDQSWYQGIVKEFDELSGKHKVQYEDGEEEELYLCKERIEWVEEKVKSFRRLRKGVGVTVKDEEDELGEVEEDDEKKDESSVDGDDDSSDEDWGKNAGKEVSDDELEDMVLDDEDEAEFESSSPDTGSKKRKSDAKEMRGSSKKNKRGEAAKENAIPSSDDRGSLTEQRNKCDSE